MYSVGSFGKKISITGWCGNRRVKLLFFTSWNSIRISIGLHCSNIEHEPIEWREWDPHHRNQVKFLFSNEADWLIGLFPFAHCFRLKNTSTIFVFFMPKIAIKSGGICSKFTFSKISLYSKRKRLTATYNSARNHEATCTFHHSIDIPVLSGEIFFFSFCWKIISNIIFHLNFLVPLNLFKM